MVHGDCLSSRHSFSPGFEFRCVSFQCFCLLYVLPDGTVQLVFGDDLQHPVGAENSNWIADQDFLGLHPMVSHRRCYRITGRRSLGKYRRSFWYIVPGRFAG